MLVLLEMMLGRTFLGFDVWTLERWLWSVLEVSVPGVQVKTQRNAPKGKGRAREDVPTANVN